MDAVFGLETDVVEGAAKLQQPGFDRKLQKQIEKPHPKPKLDHACQQAKSEKDFAAADRFAMNLIAQVSVDGRAIRSAGMGIENMTKIIKSRPWHRCVRPLGSNTPLW